MTGRPSAGSWEIVLRAEAIERGEKSYFTGQPCINGHVERRAILSAACAGCVREAHAKAKRTDPDHYKKLKADAYLRQKPQRGEAAKRYSAENKEKIAARMKRWGEANAEQIAEKKKAYRARTSEAETRRAKAYREANKDRIRQYYEANKFRYAHRNRMRQARELQATPTWADLGAIRAMYREAAEKSEVTGIKHHVDHIHPLKGKNFCGLHVEYNLQVIPEIENLKKGNRLQAA